MGRPALSIGQVRRSAVASFFVDRSRRRRLSQEFFPFEVQRQQPQGTVQMRRRAGHE
jgi:hypothetical protein